MTEQEIKGMGFWEQIWEHVNELRKRLFKALIGLIVATLISFTVAPMFIDILARPIGGTEFLISIEVTENISTFMRVSLLSGFIIALPIIFYQIWAFISPGLYENEKHWLMLAIPFATLLFISGVVFAYFVMLPAALPFLISFMGITTTPRLINYFTFVTNLLFWVGVCFEAPLIVFILAKMGFVTARSLLKGWRIAIVVIAVVAAVVTPTGDPVNMGLMMLPLTVLYLLSVLFAVFARRGKSESDKRAKPRRKNKPKKKEPVSPADSDRV
jgi:sec-independent protein translocase protein TatC